ncbi:MAG: peptide ABC transporter substrate-binding protein [Pseudobdellovibrio sp.]
MNKPILILLFVSLSYLTCFAEEIPLRIAVVQEFGQFNPITVNLASTESFMHFLMREMTTQDEKGKLIPDLAEKIPSLENKLASIITENKIKKVKAQWTIKKAATWSDGKPVTCQDWWLGWQAGLSANTMTQEKTMYSKIEKIEWAAADIKKCSVTYTTSSWAFDRDLPYPIPYHLENSVFEKWKNQKEAYDQNTLYVTKPETIGLYNGPFVIQEFKLGSHFILTINPYFYGDKPKINKIAVQHMGEANSLKANLKTKSINMISAVGFPPDLAFTFSESEAGSDYKVFFQDSPIFQGIFFNHDSPFLSDIKIRKAISLAINKKKITEAFFNSKLKPAETFIPPNFSEFTQHPVSFDKEKAKKLLDEAGWKVTDKKFRTKNGKDLIIDFKTSSGIKILETIQVFMCDELAQVQIGCSIKNQPPRILLGDTTAKGEFEMAMFGNSILPDTSLTSLFSSKEIPTKENSWTGANNLRWRSPIADKLLLQFDQENSKTKRSKILAALEKEILDQVVFVPIYHRREAAVIPNNLQGLTYLGKGTNFMFPESWLIK